MTVSKSNSDLFNIPGYYFISNSREHKLGGGVGLYIQSDMNFKPRIDLQSSDTIHCTNQSLWKSCDLMVKILLLAASLDLPMPLSVTLTGLLKISCQPSVLRISYLIPREAPIREVYNLVARESRVYHSSIARPA